MTFDEVRSLFLGLPGVVDWPSYGTPGFRVGRRFNSRLREHDVLVLKPVEDIEREMLLGTRPEASFLTDLYRGSDCVLVRLSKVDPVQLRDLLESSWRRLVGRRMLAAYEGVPAGWLRPERAKEQA